MDEMTQQNAALAEESAAAASSLNEQIMALRDMVSHFVTNDAASRERPAPADTTRLRELARAAALEPRSRPGKPQAAIPSGARHAPAKKVVGGSRSTGGWDEF